MDDDDSLRQRLIGKRPREFDGTRASNRTSFQKDWAVCHIVDLHQDESRHNYLMILDYHDDVVVLNSDNVPTGVEFYQVKSRLRKAWSGWTVSRLFERESPPRDDGEETPDDLPSATRLALSTGAEQICAAASEITPKTILGKLCANYVHFEQHTAGLYLVSNSPFDLRSAAGTSTLQATTTKLAELAPDIFGDIIRRLREELGVATDKPYAPPLFFLQTTLHPRDSRTSAIGKITTFLESKTQGSSLPFPAVAFYRTLYDEVRRKTEYEWTLASFEDIVRHKAISKSSVDKLIEACDPYWTPQAVWARALPLFGKSLSARRLRDLKHNWEAHEANCMNDADAAFRQLRRRIVTIARDVVESGRYEALADIMNVGYADLQASGEPIADKYNQEPYLMAAILLEAMYFYEKGEERQLQAPRAEPSEEDV